MYDRTRNHTLLMIPPLRYALLLAAAAATLTCNLAAQEVSRPAVSGLRLAPAPAVSGLVFRKGDRLAICGDSITEQKQYSVLLDAYLTACLPDLGITCRQYGWSGERTTGFLARMKNDVLRFQPTVATTCYGMNDHRYVPYTDEIGAEYRKAQQAVVDAFKAAGVRVIVGSSGTIATVPHWVKSAQGTWQDLNASLARLRGIALETAVGADQRFADVFSPMLTATTVAEQRFGPDFKVAGKDGVHPDWAGQVIMASAFLHAMGVDGAVGMVTFDAAAGSATTDTGHAVREASADTIHLTSTRWPFCAPAGPLDKDNSIRAGMALSDFDERFNRFTLVVRNLKAPRATVQWGNGSVTFTREALEKGVNLAAAFPENPFSAPFAALQEAVRARQAYETKQIKQVLHGPEGKQDMEAAVRATETERAPLAAAVAAAHRPLDHTIRVTPLP